jgi:hypothetical protein
MDKRAFYEKWSGISRQSMKDSIEETDAVYENLVNGSTTLEEESMKRLAEFAYIVGVLSERGSIDEKEALDLLTHIASFGKIMQFCGSERTPIREEN